MRDFTDYCVRHFCFFFRCKVVRQWIESNRALLVNFEIAPSISILLFFLFYYLSLIGLVKTIFIST